MSPRRDHGPGVRDRPAPRGVPRLALPLWSEAQLDALAGDLASLAAKIAAADFEVEQAAHDGARGAAAAEGLRLRRERLRRVAGLHSDSLRFALGLVARADSFAAAQTPGVVDELAAALAPIALEPEEDAHAA